MTGADEAPDYGERSPGPHGPPDGVVISGFGKHLVGLITYAETVRNGTSMTGRKIKPAL
jgi:hypothetical protein